MKKEKMSQGGITGDIISNYSNCDATSDYRRK